MITNPWYDTGYDCGRHRKGSDDYDPRFDFADAAKAGHQQFEDFKRGFEDGFDGKDKESQ